MKIDGLLPNFQDILDGICSGRDIREVLQLVLDRACELAGARHGSLMRIEAETQTLVILCTSGEGWNEDNLLVRLKVGEGVTGTVAATGKPYLCEDTEHDPKCIVLFPSMKSEVAVPVIIDQEVWAVINMDAETYGAFNQETVASLSAFAETVSFAIQSHVRPR